MVSFENDYNNGAVPEILRRLTETNDEKSSGYGYDKYTRSAADKIRSLCHIPEAEVYFLTGGTQTNATVIDSLLQGCEGVLCASTGHINVHESGAVEAFGHKVIALPGEDSKLDARDLENYFSRFYADGTNPHMVQPGMVYLTFPTELGALYSRKELADIYEVCKRCHQYLYVDGARLGYALASPQNDIDLPFLASHCDVFYIGGTKVGALFGEAVVYTHARAPKHIFTMIKRHGALLAKGRILGIQFDTLFTDNLYFRISRHAIDMAEKLKEIFSRHGRQMAFDSPTNQQFVVLTTEEKAALMKNVLFEVWEPRGYDRFLCRFVTSWATTEHDLQVLDDSLARCHSCSSRLDR